MTRDTVLQYASWAAHLQAIVAAGEPSKWWFGGGERVVRNQAAHWRRLLSRDNFHCVFCCRDLTADLEVLGGRAVDWLIAPELFPSEDKAGRPWNFAACCASCGVLRRGWAPRLTDWSSRHSYIVATRRHLAALRKTSRAQAVQYLRGRHIQIWSERICREHGDYV
jgi:hypothetical protein